MRRKSQLILFIIALLLCLCTIVAQLDKDLETDIAWEFNTDKNPYRSGWGNASESMIDLSAKEEKGELRCSIVGYNPQLDSPNLFLTISQRHYLVMRSRYDGTATKARLLLRSGSVPSPREQNVARLAYWSERQPMVAIVSSEPSNSNSSMANSVDGDEYSLFRTNSTVNSFMTFDLGSFRWITGVRILTSGDESSPRRCLLMRSTTTGVGPFEIVTMITLKPRTLLNTSIDTTQQDNYFNNPQGGYTIEEQEFRSFQAYGRYFKMVFVDNYGGDTTAVREIILDGYDERVTMVPFDIDNSGRYAMTYLPLSGYLLGNLLKMRFELAIPSSINTPSIQPQTRFMEMWSIDYIRIIRAPEVFKVRGCLDKYFMSADLRNPAYNVTSHLHMINDHLPIRWYTKQNLTSPYATTYDCPLAGGTMLTIEGINFGSSPVVWIGSSKCDVLSVAYSAIEGRRQQITCRLPPSNTSGPVRVRVQSGTHAALFYDFPGLSYRVAPPVPSRPVVTNLGAFKVDLIWQPPVDVFAAMTVTGYKIIYFPAAFPHFPSNLTVGNVTTTSVRGLRPATEYIFAIAAVAEGSEAAALPTDLYGRRDLLPHAFVGEFSTYTNATGTLAHDFSFSFFNANQTLNNSGVSSVFTDGPTGQFGSEGAFGLFMVGSANIENCNVSSTCCDGYNATFGVASCGKYRSVCSVLPARMLASDFVINGVTRRIVPSNLPAANGAPPEIFISTLEELMENRGAKLPTSACGPALRLTPSEPRQSGSVWYGRKMNVHEGFDTTIRFKISNPSQKCDRMDDVNTYCRSRGADGWAFVLQNERPDALGLAGSGLGYSGIFNSLAVELDTYHNFEQLDSYENHISVMTQGFRYNITANHSRSLATTNKIPDLTDGEHVIRIKYDPAFDEEAVPHPSFQVNGYTTWFLNVSIFLFSADTEHL